MADDEVRRYAIVDAGGVVQNVILARKDFDPGEGLRLVADSYTKAGIGYTLNGKKFEPPPDPPPDPEEPATSDETPTG